MTPRQFLRQLSPPSPVERLIADIEETLQHTINKMNQSNLEMADANRGSAQIDGGSLKVGLTFGFSDGLLTVKVVERERTLSYFDWRHSIVGTLTIVGAILHTGTRHGWLAQSSLHGSPCIATVIFEARPVKP